MNLLAKVVGLYCIVCFGFVRADPFNDMIIAIKSSDCTRIQEIAQSTSFTEQEQQSFLILAQEKLKECRLTRDWRVFNWRASLALKFLAPLWGKILGFCIDPREIGLVLAVLQASLSVAAYKVAEHSCDEDLGLVCVGIGISAVVGGCVYYKLEEWIGKHMDQVDNAVTQAIEKAFDCKVMLIRLYGTHNIDLL